MAQLDERRHRGCVVWNCTGSSFSLADNIFQHHLPSNVYPSVRSPHRLFTTNLLFSQCISTECATYINNAPHFCAKIKHLLSSTNM